MTQKKPFSPKLILILAGAGLLLVTLLVVVVVVALSAGQSPSDVLKATFLDANEGRYSDANNGLSSQMRAIHDRAGYAKVLWDAVTRKGSITKVEILKEEIRGEGATVRFKIHYKDGRTFECEEDLIKENGSWKLASNHYLLARMDLAGPVEKAPFDPFNGDPDLFPKPGPKQRRPNAQGFLAIDHFLGISPDFKVYAVSEDGGVKLFDLESGKPVKSPTWDRDWGSAKAAVFGKDTLAVIAGRHFSTSTVKVFSTQTGELIQNIRGQTNEAAFTQDGRFLALVESQGINEPHLILRDIASKTTVADIRVGNQSLCIAAKYAATYLPRDPGDGEVFIVEIETGTVAERLKTSKFLKPTRGGYDYRMPMALSRQGNLLACAKADDVTVYDIKAGKVLHTLEGHLDYVEAVAFHPEGEIVASGGKDKTVRFWKVKDGKQVSVFKNLPATPSNLVLANDGKRIVVVYRGGWGFIRTTKAEIRSVELK
jgi:hypothetical protein